MLRLRVHDERVHDVAEVLHELADTIPDLPGARCKGHTELFDRTIAYPHSDRRALTDLARTQALQTCACCPVLDRCREWFEALAPERPAGGVVNTARKSNIVGHFLGFLALTTFPVSVSTSASERSPSSP